MPEVGNCVILTCVNGLESASAYVPKSAWFKSVSVAAVTILDELEEVGNALYGFAVAVGVVAPVQVAAPKPIPK